MRDAKICPKCGYENNRSSAKMCGLCGGVFPEVKAQINADIKREVAAVQVDDVPAISRRDFALEMARNRRLSIVLILGFPIILIGLGWAIGGYIGYSSFGIIFLTVWSQA